MERVAPQRYLKLNNQPLSDLAPVANSSISSISVEEAIGHTGKCEIVFNDTIDFDLKPNHTKFKTQLSLSLGYPSYLRQVFYGLVVSRELNCDQSDNAKMVLTAYDLSHQMKIKPPDRIFKETNLYNVIKKIVDLNGLKFYTDDAEPLRSMKLEDGKDIAQVNMTDWEFLSELTKIVNYRLFCQADTVYAVSEKYTCGDSLTFIYSPKIDEIDMTKKFPILSINPRAGMIDQRQVVEVISWSEVKEKEYEYGKQNLDNLSDGSQGYTDIKIQTDAVETLRVSGVATNSAQAKRMAEAELRRRATDLVSGDVTLIGDPSISIANKHHFKINAFGLSGQEFEGDYTVWGVRHVWDGDGFRTELDLKNNKMKKI